jgi:hypothetical protein
MTSHHKKPAEAGLKLIKIKKQVQNNHLDASSYSEKDAQYDNY